MNPKSLKRTVLSALIAVIVLGLVFVHIAPTFSPNSDQPLAIMVDGKLYYVQYGQGGNPSTDADIVGHITSLVDLSVLPDKNDQANFPAAQDQPYAWVDGELYLYFSEQWHLCEPKN